MVSGPTKPVGSPFDKKLIFSSPEPPKYLPLPECLCHASPNDAGPNGAIRSGRPLPLAPRGEPLMGGPAQHLGRSLKGTKAGEGPGARDRDGGGYGGSAWSGARVWRKERGREMIGGSQAQPASSDYIRRQPVEQPLEAGGAIPHFNSMRHLCIRTGERRPFVVPAGVGARGR